MIKLQAFLSISEPLSPVKFQQWHAWHNLVPVLVWQMLLSSSFASSHAFPVQSASDRHEAREHDPQS